MKCTSSRFGPLEIPDETVLQFATGLLGFPDHRRYVILDHDTDAPFKWLQSVDEPALAFVIIDPALFHPRYHIGCAQETLAELGGGEPHSLTVAVILTIPSDDPSRVTANLRGPLLMHPGTRLCKQVVLSDEFPTRYPLFPGAMPDSAGTLPSLSTAACSA